ncbi:MAG: hypothetical protein Q7U04_02295 [Bacteriovorax sp.]|nr:hypothetical protein [Bacteriovorax sp.]
MKRLLILLFALSFTATALAKNIRGTAGEVFGPMSKQFVETLLDRGIIKIGKLDLEKLLSELDEVQWRFMEEGFLMGSGGVRFTGIYIVKNKMVVINIPGLELLQKKPVPLTPWTLHEAMGALGYEDENYELSSVISFVAQTDEDTPIPVDFVKNKFSKIDRRQSDRTYLLAGGATVIGGGGDAVLVQLKQLLLKQYFKLIKDKTLKKSQEQIRSDFEKITTLPIEFLCEPDGTLNYERFDLKYEDSKLRVGLAYHIMTAELYKAENLNSILNFILK